MGVMVEGDRGDDGRMVSTAQQKARHDRREAARRRSLSQSPPDGGQPIDALRELYDRLAPHLGRSRAEIVDGRLVVSPSPLPEHQRTVMKLAMALDGVARQRGWTVWPGVGLCLPGSRHPFEPDVVVGPEDAPRWGDREIYTDGVVLVAEIVSPGSARVDRDRKPEIYASGGVPLLLLVDPLDDARTVTVFGGLRDGRYTETSTVEFGGELKVPPPIGFVLDTAALGDEPQRRA